MMAVSSTSSFFGYNVSREAAKREVQSVLSPDKLRAPTSPHSKDPEFSSKAKKLFESALTVMCWLKTILFAPQSWIHTIQAIYCLLYSLGLLILSIPGNLLANIASGTFTLAHARFILQESRRSGMSTITVEHIVIALFAGGSGCRGILARYVQARYLAILMPCLQQHVLIASVVVQDGIQS